MDPEAKLEQPLLPLLLTDKEEPRVTESQLNAYFPACMAVLYVCTFTYFYIRYESVTPPLENWGPWNDVLPIWAPPCVMWALFALRIVGFDVCGDAHVMIIPRLVAAVSATQAEHLLAMGLGHDKDDRLVIFVCNALLGFESCICAITFEELFELPETGEEDEQKQELVSIKNTSLYQAGGFGVVKCLTPLVMLHEAIHLPEWTLPLFCLVLVWNYLLSGGPYAIFMETSFASGARRFKRARFGAAAGEAICNFVFAMFAVAIYLSKE